MAGLPAARWSGPLSATARKTAAWETWRGRAGSSASAWARSHPADDERVARWIANRRALQHAFATGLATDAQLASEARRRALETGAAEMRWANPGTGHSGVISEKKRWRSAAGEACVRYGWKSRQAAGRAETGGEETACRQAGGPWRVR